MIHEVAGGDAMLARKLLRAGGHDPDTDIVAPDAVLGSSGVEAITECFAATLKDRTPAGFMSIIAKHFRQGYIGLAKVAAGFCAFRIVPPMWTSRRIPSCIFLTNMRT
jgi:hypothetical protein